MAVPKKKTSKARGRKRRTHYNKTSSPTITICHECQEPRLTHKACPECGAYKKSKATTKD